MADDLTTTLTSGAIRFTGLGSGTDFDSMITQLIEAERAHTYRLESWRAEWEAKSESFDELTSAMVSLQTTLGTLNTTDEFLTKTVASSNTTALSASASSDAEESSHSVEVVSLATNDMHMGTEIFSSTSDLVGDGAAGTFTFTYGSHQISIDTTATTTLAQFVTLINSDADNANYVRASVINDGSGYRLQIRGMDLGAGNDFVIQEATNLSKVEADNFVETQNASNAQLKIDGWPTDSLLTPTADSLQATFTGTSASPKTVDSIVASSGGTFAFTHAGELYTVTVDATTTYSDLASAITSAVTTAHPGSAFTAQAVASGNNVTLTLTGDTGSENQINIVDSPATTISSLQSGKFKQITGATDGYIERDSNSIADAVPGLTLNLLATGTTTLTTSVDTASVLTNAQTFVDAVNEVLSVIKELTQVETVGESTSGSILTGNYGLQMIQQNIKTILASKGLGFDYDMDSVTTLGSVGITTDTSEGSPTFGLLTLDADAFLSALEEDSDGVARLFSADYYPATKETVNGESVTSSNFKFDSFIRGVTEAGEYDISYTISGGTVTGATINGYAAAYDAATGTLTAEGTGNTARGLAIEIVNFVDGSYSGSVQIKSGKTEELYQTIKKLTDSNSGTLEILKDNYQDIMDSIDDKIAYEEARLTLMESNMRTRFASLESLLGTYDSISSQLESSIASLSS